MRLLRFKLLKFLLDGSGVKALCYKPEIAGSSPDEVIGFFN
jgi:hypothetical protein